MVKVIIAVTLAVRIGPDHRRTTLRFVSSQCEAPCQPHQDDFADWIVTRANQGLGRLRAC